MENRLKKKLHVQGKLVSLSSSRFRKTTTTNGSIKQNTCHIMLDSFHKAALKLSLYPSANPSAMIMTVFSHWLKCVGNLITHSKRLNGKIYCE